MYRLPHILCTSGAFQALNVLSSHLIFSTAFYKRRAELSTSINNEPRSQSQPTDAWMCFCLTLKPMSPTSLAGRMGTVGVYTWLVIFLYSFSNLSILD